MKHRTMIFAHRGFSARYPENTMVAFQAAYDSGADGIELDVQLTKDRIPVIIHDETINRTTDGAGFVKDFTFNELRKWDAGTIKNNHEQKCLIPSLDEYFQWVKQTDLITNIELKNGMISYEGLEEIILEMITTYELEDQIILSSFNHYSLAKIAELNPNIETAILFMEGLYKPWDYARTVGARGLHCFYPVAQKPIIDQAATEQIAVRPFTVNEEEDLKRLIFYQCPAVITDHVDQALLIRQKYDEHSKMSEFEERT
ncbi:glycerophosphodiester phosphodiesterase [Halalkalibacter sp. APA_J-10(15)]|uniref:glycerophosphodiester phosphodiesterase n=1 Tax=unclassified Halalkalibacter TaxID=2893063 RepID=UPI001FF3033C|nr:glycerophosphodiester phosphodiesterase [Halalkalibacter sp. APA_J-10(15)]MCK0473078.1 glycerophosphodiester phosphodiesterase [Halalkalibacter sp. APA_J-10(15)]